MASLLLYRALAVSFGKQRGLEDSLGASKTAFGPLNENLFVDYTFKKNSVIIADPFVISAAHAIKGANASKTISIVADVFLADSCIKFASVITCDYQFLNFSLVEPEIMATYDDSVCSDSQPCDGVKPTTTQMGRRSPTRVLHRDGSNWEPVTIGQLCLPELEKAVRVDLNLWYGDQHKAYSLKRISRAHSSDFAMMAMYRGDVWTSPAWFDVWEKLGIGHFYIYYDGHIDDMRAEAPDVLDALERDRRVTLHTWPYPMRSVIADSTGRSKLPAVNKYGKILCYLHYAKMMAFNDAFHRYGSRHKYMGFFDFDEYMGLPQEVLDAAKFKGISPLQEVYDGLPETKPDWLVMQNRWMGVFPLVKVKQPLTTGVILNRKIYGGWYTGWPERSKFFVKSDEVGDPDKQPYMVGGVKCSEYRWLSHGHVCLIRRVIFVPRMQVGNHFICKLRDHAMIGKDRKISQYRGPCDLPAENSPAIVQLPPPGYYSMHLLNLKPHESLLDFDADSMLDQMLVNDTEVKHIHALLQGH